jgi:hypothetical protein
VDSRPKWRASPLEIVGAWLGIWTPRRDTYIPPVPVFRLLLGAVAVGVVIAASLHFISEGRRLGAERDRREAAAARARTRARQAKEQIPRHARLVGPAAAGATVEQLTARRHRIVNALEVAITGDARRRYRVHAFESRVLHTTCVPFSRSSASPPPEPPLRAASGKYECNAATAEIPRTERAAAGEIGYPFWARVDYRRGTATWCKINPLPGERGIGGEVFVQLAPACDLFRG